MNPLEMLLAKSEIEDCLKRYARGVDRRDWEGVRACFHPDAIDHHGEFRGTCDEFIVWVSARHAEIPFAMHYLLNCLIEFMSDRSASVETYFWAIQRRETRSEAGPAAGTDFEVFGRYVDQFEKRDGVWRIADRKVTYDFDPPVAQLQPPAQDDGRARATRQGRSGVRPTAGRGVRRPGCAALHSAALHWCPRTASSVAAAAPDAAPHQRRFSDIG